MPTPAPRPDRASRAILGAEEAPKGRWWAYVGNHSIKCPCGHHLPEKVVIPEFGFIRCNHWIGKERRECGLWLFVLVIRGGRAIVAEVQLEERNDMKRLSTPAEVIDYLGIWR